MKYSEDLAELVDRIDNLRCALDLPMPPEFHVKQMKVELEELSKELNRYISKKKMMIHENGKDVK